MSTRVWVLGDAVVDLLPESQGRLLQCPGGAPANVAVGIARLGGESAFIGKVGDDPFGRFMYQTLSKENVDTRYMSLDPQHRTSIVAVGLDEQGERNFTFMVRPSADLFLQPDDLPTFGPGEWLHLCSIALSAEPSRSTAFLAMEKIRQAGGNISFDPNIRSDLWQSEALLRKYLDRALSLANIAKLSEEELLFISGESQVLITQGKNGVLVYFQGQFIHYPAKPVSVVDTTGAGDAFVAGLLAGLADSGIPTNTRQLERIIAQAQICGALATTAKGAMTALPRQHDLPSQ